MTKYQAPDIKKVFTSTTPFALILFRTQLINAAGMPGPRRKFPTSCSLAVRLLNRFTSCFSAVFPFRLSIQESIIEVYTILLEISRESTLGPAFLPSLVALRACPGGLHGYLFWRASPPLGLALRR